MNAAEFKSVFGNAEPGSRSARVSKQLAVHEGGKGLAASIGFGRFRSGFLSIASLREDISLGKWSRWLPKGAFLYASSAFGMLYVSAGDLMWLVNTQTGSILPTGYALDDAILKAATESTRENLLNLPLFEAWLEAGNQLGKTEILAPSIPLIRGGSLAAESLVKTPMQIYLESTAAMFDDHGRAAISLMNPREDG